MRRVIRAKFAGGFALVADYRLRLGWTQLELARAAHVSERTVHRIEAGLSTSPKSARAVAAVLESPVRELFDVETVEGSQTRLERVANG